MSKLETWVLDVELKPMLAYIWDRWNINVGLNQIVEDWSILAWSAKRLNDPHSLVYKDLRDSKDYSNDRKILLPLRDILDKADIVITQNGTQFDVKKINARCIINKIDPPSEYKHFDTVVLSRRVASFTSTKLEYVTDKVNTKHKKTFHPKFVGISLWVECLKGNKQAWDEMKKYNIEDTLSTEELALNLKQWAPKAFPDWNDEKCEDCGKVKKLRIKCQSCNTWRNK